MIRERQIDSVGVCIEDVGRKEFNDLKVLTYMQFSGIVAQLWEGGLFM